MKTPLALCNLIHQRGRTLLAIAGVGFAVILVFLQLGFFGSVTSTATLVFEQLDFDLALVSSQYLDINRAGTLDQRRLGMALAVPGVESAAPLYVGFNLWRNPLTRQRRKIMLLAAPLAQPVFRSAEIRKQLPLLDKRDTVLLDRKSRAEFGPQAPGTIAELGTVNVEIVGRFTLGAGFLADGTVVTSDRTFFHILAEFPRSRASVGLVRLAAGTSAEGTARILAELLPADVRVLTRAELESQEQNRWTRQTSVGVIFGLGVIVAILVGIVFVYQVIASDIGNRLAEFATLKALGYGPRYLSAVVFQQALILSVLGYLPGLLAALGLYALTRTAANIPIGMTGPRALAVLALAVGMCSVSGLLSLRKVHQADPAELF